MNNVMQISKLIIKRMFKKPLNLVVHFIIPIISVILMSQIYNLIQEEPITIYMVDESNDVITRTYFELIDDMSHFNVEAIDSENIAQPDGVYYQMMIHFSKDFSKKNMDVTFYITEDTPLSDGLKIFTDGYLNTARNSDLEGYDLRNQLLENYKNDVFMINDVSREKEVFTSVFGIYLLILLLTSCLVSFKILKEKEIGTFYRIGLSPVHPKIYVLSNIISNLIVAGGQIIIVLISLKVFTEITFYGGLINTFIILFAFAICSVSVGVLISTSVDSFNMANGVMGMILSPSCMLAGCMWPIKFMPELLQKLAYLMPQRWVLDALNAIQRKGSLMDGITHIIIILGFTLLFFLLSVYQLNKK